MSKKPIPTEYIPVQVSSGIDPNGYWINNRKSTFIILDYLTDDELMIHLHGEAISIMLNKKAIAKLKQIITEMES